MGISLGLVGLGAFGSGFADLFKSHPLVDRIALCDREPERVEKFAKKESWQDKFDPKDAYDSLDAICESDLDALVIITQPWLHAPQCIQAMESGKHVYSAVPIISVPDGDEILDWCDKLVDCCKRTGRYYMLGETTYYRPNAQFCRRKAGEGAFGNFVFAEGEYFHNYLDLFKVQKHRLNSKAGREWKERAKVYRERKVVSGPMHYPTHSTSGPVCVMNAHAVKVNAHAYRSSLDNAYFKGGISNETALFKMSNNATVRICEFREAAGHLGAHETFRVVGTLGTYAENWWKEIVSQEPPGKTDYTQMTDEEMRDPFPDEVAQAFNKIFNARGHKGDINKDFTPRGHGGSHPYLVHEFVDAVANDRQPAINIWEAVRYMAMGVMAHKSALQDGTTLDVPDWGDAPA